MAAPTRKRILVIGMSGLIGGLVGRKLAERHEVRALNRSAVEGYQTFRADIADLDAIRPAFEGVDTVINMANVLPQGGSACAGSQESDFVGHSGGGRRRVHLYERSRRL